MNLNEFFPILVPLVLLFGSLQAWIDLETRSTEQKVSGIFHDWTVLFVSLFFFYNLMYIFLNEGVFPSNQISILVRVSILFFGYFLLGSTFHSLRSLQFRFFGLISVSFLLLEGITYLFPLGAEYISAGIYLSLGIFGLVQSFFPIDTPFQVKSDSSPQDSLVRLSRISGIFGLALLPLFFSILGSFLVLFQVEDSSSDSLGYYWERLVTSCILGGLGFWVLIKLAKNKSSAESLIMGAWIGVGFTSAGFQFGSGFGFFLLIFLCLVCVGTLFLVFEDRLPGLREKLLVFGLGIPSFLGLGTNLCIKRESEVLMDSLFGSGSIFFPLFQYIFLVGIFSLVFVGIGIWSLSWFRKDS
jgi:hypothetical protein